MQLHIWIELEKKIYALSEARTQNLGIAHRILTYKYRALTNCANRAMPGNALIRNIDFMTILSIPFRSITAALFTLFNLNSLRQFEDYHLTRKNKKKSNVIQMSV